MVIYYLWDRTELIQEIESGTDNLHVCIKVVTVLFLHFMLTISVFFFFSLFLYPN